MRTTVMRLVDVVVPVALGGVVSTPLWVAANEAEGFDGLGWAILGLGVALLVGTATAVLNEGLAGGRRGWTVGSRLVGLRLQGADGETPGFWRVTSAGAIWWVGAAVGGGLATGGGPVFGLVAVLALLVVLFGPADGGLIVHRALGVVVVRAADRVPVRGLPPFAGRSGPGLAVTAGIVTAIAVVVGGTGQVLEQVRYERYADAREEARDRIASEVESALPDARPILRPPPQARYEPVVLEVGDGPGLAAEIESALDRLDADRYRWHEATPVGARHAVWCVEPIPPGWRPPDCEFRVLVFGAGVLGDAAYRYPELPQAGPPAGARWIVIGS